MAVRYTLGQITQKYFDFCLKKMINVWRIFNTLVRVDIRTPTYFYYKSSFWPYIVSQLILTIRYKLTHFDDSFTLLFQLENVTKRRRSWRTWGRARVQTRRKRQKRKRMAKEREKDLGEKATWSHVWKTKGRVPSFGERRRDSGECGPLDFSWSWNKSSSKLF